MYGALCQRERSTLLGAGSSAFPEPRDTCYPCTAGRLAPAALPFKTPQLESQETTRNETQATNVFIRGLSLSYPLCLTQNPQKQKKEVESVGKAISVPQR